MQSRTSSHRHQHLCPPINGMGASINKGGGREGGDTNTGHRGLSLRNRNVTCQLHRICMSLSGRHGRCDYSSRLARRSQGFRVAAPVFQSTDTHPPPPFHSPSRPLRAGHGREEGIEISFRRFQKFRRFRICDLKPLNQVETAGVG